MESVRMVSAVLSDGGRRYTCGVSVRRCCVCGLEVRLSDESLPPHSSQLKLHAVAPGGPPEGHRER